MNVSISVSYVNRVCQRVNHQAHYTAKTALCMNWLWLDDYPTNFLSSLYVIMYLDTQINKHIIWLDGWQRRACQQQCANAPVLEGWGEGAMVLVASAWLTWRWVWRWCLVRLLGRNGWLGLLFVAYIQLLLKISDDTLTESSPDQEDNHFSYSRHGIKHQSDSIFPPKIQNFLYKLNQIANLIIISLKFFH